jgi:PLP dependent protein
VASVSRRASADAATVRASVEAVRDRIQRAGGDPSRTTLVAVTKGFGADAVAAAAAAGLTEVGENYAQELVAKAEALPPEAAAHVRWHFLGPVQRNKVASLAPHVARWHAIDRPAVARAVAERAGPARVMVQVNTTPDARRPGVTVESAPGLVDELAALGLAVDGLMTVAPLGPPEEARAGFRAVARLAGRLGLPELSMGMTDDLEVAIQEGATIIRIGRGLFGPRPGRRAVPG